MLDPSDMPATKKRSYARYTLAATALLGNFVKLERKVRRISAQGLAERLGVSRETVVRLEKGDPKVELGLAFEACALLSIPLFEEDLPAISRRVEETTSRLALLPKRTRARQVKVDNDF